MPKNPKTNPPDSEDGEEAPKRQSTPGARTRKDKGPSVFNVKPVPMPNPKELGTLTRWTSEILKGGPRALIAAEHKAAKLAKEFGIELEAAWCLTTPYIEQLRTTQRRAAEYALQWRPRYLAVLSLSRSDIFASRAARIAKMTAYRHRKLDPAFNQQCEEAEAHAIQLLHDVTMKSAIEGECEPVYWQGIPVGHIRKVDNRLRVEMLRAHMPKVFKTPGAKVAINTGNLQNNFFVCGPEEQDALIAQRQEALKTIQEQREKAAALPAITVEVESEVIA